MGLVCLSIGTPNVDFISQIEGHMAFYQNLDAETLGKFSHPLLKKL